MSTVDLQWECRGVCIGVSLNTYFGKDAAQFYSALGSGNTAFTARIVHYWRLAPGNHDASQAATAGDSPHRSSLAILGR